jgi:hypothetical protein
MLNPGHGDDALEISPTFAERPASGSPRRFCAYLSSHEPDGGLRGKVRALRPGSGRFDAPRVRTEYHASSRGAGERFTTRTLKDCALVLWAICESADATRKKIIPPARLSLLERFNKKGPEDCESFSA